MNETKVSLLKKIKQTLFLLSSIFFLKREGCQQSNCQKKKNQSKDIIDSLFDRFSAQFCFEFDTAK